MSAPFLTPYVYLARVVSVHDADTLLADVDLGFGVSIRMPLRLNGLNAPELSTPAGKVAAIWLQARLPAGQQILLATIKDRREKYGRYLAEIFLDGEPLNTALIAAGHAVAWDGHGPRPG